MFVREMHQCLQTPAPGDRNDRTEEANEGRGGWETVKDRVRHGGMAQGRLDGAGVGAKCTGQ